MTKEQASNIAQHAIQAALVAAILWAGSTLVQSREDIVALRVKIEILEQRVQQQTDAIQTASIQASAAAAFAGRTR